MWIKSKRRFLLAFIFFVIIGVGAYSSSFIKKEKKEEFLPSVKQDIKQNIKLAFVGDIMLDRGVRQSVYKNFAGDYAGLFSKVSECLNNYDFLFGNLEGPVSDMGVDGGSIYSFRMEPGVLSALKTAGFNAFSLDNNHILNYGLEALADTKARLKQSNLLIGGESFILAGVKIVILTFNQFANLDLEDMIEKVETAKLSNDLVITYFHFGDEYAPEPNDYQKNIARLAIDAGADLVVGAHPHVVEPVEKYNGKYIAYSLGNFIFDQYFSPETMSGGLLEVEIDPNSKQIKKVSLKKVLLNKFYQIESIE